MLVFAQVSLGEGGHAGCARCGRRAGAASYLPAATIVGDIERAASDWPGGPGPNVELTGPEPLAHPELPALVGSAIAAGVSRVRLDTDAAPFSVGGNAAGAVAAGVRHIRFTLLAGTPGVHDALVGAPGAFDATLSGVRAYVEAAGTQARRVHVSANVPVCRHSVHDVPAAVGAACSAGAGEVLLHVEDGGLDLRSAVEWVSSACATGVVNRTWVQVEGVPVCMLPDDLLHVADVVRERRGEHGPRCGECAVRDVCPGGPPEASASTLAALAPPEDAVRLASRMRRARERILT